MNYYLIGYPTQPSTAQLLLQVIVENEIEEIEAEPKKAAQPAKKDPPKVKNIERKPEADVKKTKAEEIKNRIREKPKTKKKPKVRKTKVKRIHMGISEKQS